VFYYTGHSTETALAFENSICDGQTDLLHIDFLKEIFNNLKQNIRLWFLNSCSTLQLGNELVKIGIQHVICWDGDIEGKK
jgi:hypothetical protein